MTEPTDPPAALAAAGVPLGTVLVGDCCPLMRSLPSGFADLVFADPPFNIGYGYDVYRDDLDRRNYCRWLAQWTAEAARLVSPRGSFFLAIGDEYAADYKQQLDALGLTWRNWIVWAYTFGPHLTKKFGRNHAHILYYTRDPKRFTFNADAVRIESQRQRDGDPRADPRGRVPGDVWEFPRLPGNATERTGHPCQMPEAILERIIRVATNPGDVVFDPFGGSGTTPAVADRLDRQWLTCELSEEYAAGIRRRVRG